MQDPSQIETLLLHPILSLLSLINRGYMVKRRKHLTAYEACYRRKLKYKLTLKLLSKQSLSYLEMY